jgi:hypothetical protein
MHDANGFVQLPDVDADDLPIGSRRRVDRLDLFIGDVSCRLRRLRSGRDRHSDERRSAKHAK